MTQVITPEWVRDAIFYQIFPDRFAKSSSLHKPGNLEPWDTPPSTFGFKGGDLYGVVEHLDYLRDLGVDTIYFTPIFQSTANHRYHTFDYFSVDPILGGNAAFAALINAAHERGLRVILDGVFNHASRGFYQFNHTLENGKASPYVDWFTFRGFPVHAYDGPINYDTWWGLPALPKLNYKNNDVREFILSVAEHWIREGADGWRLDVPGEIDDDEFWREFRRRVKAANSQAYIVGEIWHPAQRWLQGDQFDAVMNYQFTRACICFFVDLDDTSRQLTRGHSYGEVRPIDAVEFSKSLDEMLRLYPPEIAFSQMNLLDSHDTARFVTVAHGDRTALELAMLTMFTYPGAPQIYYGDEIAMEGQNDPDNRRGMIWDPGESNRQALDTTKRLIALRRKHGALRRGEFTNLYASGKALAYARRLPEETVIVAVNAGREPVTFDLPTGAVVPDGTRLVDEWSGEVLVAAEGVVASIDLQARQGRVLAADPRAA
ncbi:MAG: glycoside hydrolase family 13 protein [Chloroflexi bacterium]|nr:glycoside hydrolase family 13 protein [Chloroflexota bacterium]